MIERCFQFLDAKFRCLTLGDSPDINVNTFLNKVIRSEVVKVNGSVIGGCRRCTENLCQPIWSRKRLLMAVFHRWTSPVRKKSETKLLISQRPFFEMLLISHRRNYTTHRHKRVIARPPLSCTCRRATSHRSK